MSLTVIKFTAGMALFLGLGSIIWRQACKKWIIPWPSWLAWMLENPYMLIVAHSRTITERLLLAPGMHVADLGCGAGRISIPAAQAIGATGQLDAFDVQKKMLAKTKKRAGRHGISHIRLINAKIERGTLESRSGDLYDRIILVTVLGEIPDQRQAMLEITKGLKPGGMVSITEVIPDPFYQPKKSVRELCLSCGLVEFSFTASPLAYTVMFQKP